MKFLHVTEKIVLIDNIIDAYKNGWALCNVHGIAKPPKD